MPIDRTKVLTVEQLNNYIKMLVDGNPVLGNLWVRGEISNFKVHSAGHLYFTLKDEKTRIQAVMFRTDAMKLMFVPENGMKVLVHGRVSVFQRDGIYQIYANSIEPDGIGALYAAFEQLRRKLEAEGLFDESIKKQLPKIPTRVGVITSDTGAAVRDIINVAGRRFPFAKIILYPALVQGDGAENDLISGIRYFSDNNTADVIIIGRGGGSIEDLQAFNSEKLAREIRGSRIPVISAVGHETDFTICDFASDKRAPTPSAAAELAVPESDELKRKFNNVTERLKMLIMAKTGQYRRELMFLSSSRCLTNPGAYIDDRRTELMSISRDMENAYKNIFSSKKNEYRRLTAVLEAVSPLKILASGYSAVLKTDGKAVRSVKEVNEEEEINIRVSDGSINAKVLSVKSEGESYGKEEGYV